MNALGPLAKFAAALVGKQPEDELVPRGFLGLELAEGPGKGEVRVARVLAGSPAAKAGVRDGDRLVRVAGREVAGLKDARKAVAGVKPGDAVALAVRRDGETGRPAAERHRRGGPLTMIDDHRPRPPSGSLRLRGPDGRGLDGVPVAGRGPRTARGQGTGKEAGTGQKAKAVVPFEMLASNHMVVRAKINGKGPFRLIFDLGAPITLLSNRAGEASGVVKKDAPRSFLFSMRGEASVETLEVGGLTARDLPVIVLDHPALTALGGLLRPAARRDHRVHVLRPVQDDDRLPGAGDDVRAGRLRDARPAQGPPRPPGRPEGGAAAGAGPGGRVRPDGGRAGRPPGRGRGSRSSPCSPARRPRPRG